MVTLSEAEVRKRAQRIRLVLSDVDGVLTDTGVYYSADGEQMKRFSIRDGKGAELLRNAGIGFGVVTGESSGSVQKRAEKLQAQLILLGIQDKAGVLPRILEETQLSVDQLAFIGDDVNDIGLLRSIGEMGLTGAPGDAIAAVASVVHCVCQANGGHGAFRYFADWILAHRNGPAGR